MKFEITIEKLSISFDGDSEAAQGVIERVQNVAAMITRGLRPLSVRENAPLPSPEPADDLDDTPASRPLPVHTETASPVAREAKPRRQMSEATKAKMRIAARKRVEDRRAAAAKFDDGVPERTADEVERERQAKADRIAREAHA